jgi:hypothetical protein
VFDDRIRMDICFHGGSRIFHSNMEVARRSHGQSY